MLDKLLYMTGYGIRPIDEFIGLANHIGYKHFVDFYIRIKYSAVKIHWMNNAI